jgi:membrane protein
VLPNYLYMSDTLGTIVQHSSAPITCIAFILLYKLMPNTYVKYKNVIMPGIIAGIIFTVVQYLYVHYQIKLSSYNAIYGSFAALPLFMLLLQISWSICLIGGQLCYANQCMDNYAFERQSFDLSRRFRDTVCLLLMSKICKRFANGDTAYSVRTLAKDTQLPETVVRSLLDELVSMKLLVETHNEADGASQYLPAIDIHRMTLKMVSKRIDSYGSEATSHTWRINTPEWEMLRSLRYNNRDILLIDV